MQKKRGRGQRNWVDGDGDECSKPTKTQLTEVAKELSEGCVVMLYGIPYIKATDGKLEKLES